MTVWKYYDQLRDLRVGRPSDLQIGKKYLQCHVPLDNPFTMGTQPFAQVVTLLTLEHKSFNEREVIPNKEGYEPEVYEALLASPDLNERRWTFECRSDDGAITWNYCQDFGMVEGGTNMNYLLDVNDIYKAGIMVYMHTHVPYVMADSYKDRLLGLTSKTVRDISVPVLGFFRNGWSGERYFESV